ncbi:primosomal protein N' [Tepidiphilus baoligensis]|nr:primosomal protein N' [Tepidiphilus baoligensis]
MSEGMRRVQVLLPFPGEGLFDYRVPEAVVPGQIVRVPFGRGAKLGIVWSLEADPSVPDERIKAVEAVWQGLPPLAAADRELLEFTAHYYLAPLGEVVAAMLPPALRRRKREPRTAKPDAGGSTMTVGLLPELTPGQRAALEAVPREGFSVTLLHGITGSGKTEVYLRLIADCLARGRQALLLVPEIGLTPQLTERVRARFSSARIVCLHSDAPASERSAAFVAALRGEVDIVLGTRLAVFAPFVRLGLVVVDEEHDPSYKQFEGVPYSARDLAVWRARRWNVPIVLGSATPSLESWAACEAGRYRRVALSARPSGQPLPTIELIDTTQTSAEEGVSEPLARAIEETLGRGEQALVFLNRRGYAPVVRCGHCGWVSRCPNCSVNLVFHRDDGRMHCHHCGHRETPPRACPECGALDLRPIGRGTQRLEERLQALFPQARIARIDRDAVKTLPQWETLLEEVRAGQYDLLVGTQMMAKGHDFPSLTLVGVIGADAGLYAAEVRATERMFQQLMQVAGRAGRAGAPGRVLIQTEFSQHPLFRELAAHDYAAFAGRTLAERRALRLPPFAFQALLRADDEALEPALAFLEEARSAARSLAASEAWPIRVFDPVPMRLVRLARRERAQLLVEGDHRPALHAFLERWAGALRELPHPRSLRWRLEVDPLET